METKKFGWQKLFRPSYHEVQRWWTKQKYRLVDFKRDKYNVETKVASIEYDPNRTAFIALVEYTDGEKRYIIAPQGIKVGSTVIAVRV